MVPALVTIVKQAVKMMRDLFMKNLMFLKILAMSK